MRRYRSTTRNTNRSDSGKLSTVHDYVSVYIYIPCLYLDAFNMVFILSQTNISSGIKISSFIQNHDVIHTIMPEYGELYYKTP